MPRHRNPRPRNDRTRLILEEAHLRRGSVANPLSEGVVENATTSAGWPDATARLCAQALLGVELVEAGIVAKGWDSGPEKGIVAASVVVLVVRNGNPSTSPAGTICSPGVDVSCCSWCRWGCCSCPGASELVAMSVTIAAIAVPLNAIFAVGCALALVRGRGPVGVPEPLAARRADRPAVRGLTVQEQAAATLGASAWQALRRVTPPSIRWRWPAGWCCSR